MAGRGGYHPGVPKGPFPPQPPPPAPYYGDRGGPPEYYPTAHEAYPPSQYPPQHGPPPPPHPAAGHPPTTHVVRAGHDYCKGCRRCWEVVTRSLGSSLWATALAVAGPMVYLIGSLIAAYTQTQTPILLVAGPAVGVIGSLTIITGLLAYLSLYCKMQNLLGFSAAVYRAMGDWALVSTLVVILGGWSWNLSFAVLTQITVAISPPIFIFIFCAAVMDAHARTLMDDIAVAQHALAGANGAV